MNKPFLPIISESLPEATQDIYLAYSGGVDSHVLLHLCAAEPVIKRKLKAVYIDHGLQADADVWREHCRQQCMALSVDFQSIKIDANSKPGESPEEAARKARYRALKQLLQADDVLLVAQHREDQLETLLLQLLRGGGVKGLAAMPFSLPFGQGLLIRPLLHTAKKHIEDYANSFQLKWVEDPSNQRCDYDRNFLRNQVIPLLKQRWPGLDKTIARAAKHCGIAGQMLDDWAGSVFPSIFDADDQSLRIDKWQEYNQNQRNWLLRYWIQQIGLKPPSEAVLEAIVTQIIHAKKDANPQVFIQDYLVKKYRHKLFCIPKDFFRKELSPRPWLEAEKEMRLLNGYTLKRVESSSGIDKRLWHGRNVVISYRQGGEKIKLPGRNGRHCLKKLYQEAGIPPWERDLRPLIYLNGQLAAVAGLWVAEWAWRGELGNSYQCLWQPGLKQ